MRELGGSATLAAMTDLSNDSLRSEPTWVMTQTCCGNGTSALLLLSHA
jgi:hypothetical protein